jgi:ABC-2 type transport system permease protein
VAAIYQLIHTPFLVVEVVLVFGMLSLMFSGVTWPTDMFPKPLALVAYYNPFTPFAQAFQIFLHFPVTLKELSRTFVQFSHQALFFSALLLCATLGHNVLRPPLKRLKGRA